MNTNTKQTPAEALPEGVTVAPLSEQLRLEAAVVNSFAVENNKPAMVARLELYASMAEQLETTLARSAGVGTEFDPMLIARMLRRYATALENDGGVRIGKYKPAAVREQADLIEASIGQAVTAPASAAKGVANP